MKYSSNGMSSNMHSGSGWPKSNADDNSWRALPSTQDRYDRTYNERGTGGYSGGGSSGGGMYNSGARSGQDRYGGPVSSRY